MFVYRILSISDKIIFNSRIEPMPLKLEEEYINTYIYDGLEGGFIYHDTKIAIDNGLNYLTALGLMSYTEYIGSLMPPYSSGLATTTDMSGKRANFYKFYYRMGSDYILFDRHLKQTFGDNNGVYTVYRGGLSHAYFIGGNLKIEKTRLNLSSVVAKTANSSLGFTDEGKLGLATEKYFIDFITVVTELRKKILTEQNSEWITFFLEGANLITNLLH